MKNKILDIFIFIIFINFFLIVAPDLLDAYHNDDNYSTVSNGVAFMTIFNWQ